MARKKAQGTEDTTAIVPQSDDKSKILADIQAGVGKILSASGSQMTELFRLAEKAINVGIPESYNRANRPSVRAFLVDNDAAKDASSAALSSLGRVASAVQLMQDDSEFAGIIRRKYHSGDAVQTFGIAKVLLLAEHFRGTGRDLITREKLFGLDTEAFSDVVFGPDSDHPVTVAELATTLRKARAGMPDVPGPEALNVESVQYDDGTTRSVVAENFTDEAFWTRAPRPEADIIHDVFAALTTKAPSLPRLTKLMQEYQTAEPWFLRFYEQRDTVLKAVWTKIEALQEAAEAREKRKAAAGAKTPRATGGSGIGKIKGYHRKDIACGTPTDSATVLIFDKYGIAPEARREVWERCRAYIVQTFAREGLPLKARRGDEELVRKYPLPPQKSK